MNYYVREINSSESRILDKIDIIKRYGEDVSEYTKELELIIDKVNSNNIDLSFGNAVGAIQTEAFNVAILKELKALEDKLDSHQTYLKVFFKSNCLYKEITKHERNEEKKLDQYVKECISLINDAYSIKSNDVKESKKIIQDVYKTAYEVIKAELIHHKDSNLLKYIIATNGVEYINDLVREDIKCLEENEMYDESIESIIDNLSKTGINYSFADKKLIRSILLKTDDRVAREIYSSNNSYDRMINTLEEENDDLNDLEIEYADNVENHTEKKNKHKIRAIIGAIILALNLGACKLAPSLIKKSNTSTTVLTTTEAYDSVTGEARKEEIFTPGTDKEYVRLKQYGPVNESGKRKVITYDLSDIELEDISKYIDQINEDTKYSSKETIKYSFGEQLSREEYTIIEKMVYGDSKANFDEQEFNRDLRIALTILLSCGGVFSAATVASLILYIRNRRKLDEENKKIESINSKIDMNKENIEKYIKLREETKELVQQFKDNNINIEDYERLILKKRK